MPNHLEIISRVRRLMLVNGLLDSMFISPDTVALSAVHCVAGISDGLNSVVGQLNCDYVSFTPPRPGYPLSDPQP